MTPLEQFESLPNLSIEDKGRDAYRIYADKNGNSPMLERLKDGTYAVLWMTIIAIHGETAADAINKADCYCLNYNLKYNKE